jgi:hypothetical protein
MIRLPSGFLRPDDVRPGQSASVRLSPSTQENPQPTLDLQQADCLGTNSDFLGRYSHLRLLTAYSFELLNPTQPALLGITVSVQTAVWHQFTLPNLTWGVVSGTQTLTDLTGKLT